MNTQRKMELRDHLRDQVYKLRYYGYTTEYIGIYMEGYLDGYCEGNNKLSMELKDILNSDMIIQ